MSDISKRVADLPPEKRALLARRLKESGRQVPDSPPPKSPERGERPPRQAEDEPVRALRRSGAPMDFSLFFFTGDGSTESGDRYRLVLESARFADQHGFTAVWTPERHFHRFGGLYPNPAVMSAALAMVTKRVELRAGSVVLPLHHPARIAEEWSLVDNLSQGRIGLAFASGWHPNDFVFSPGGFAERRDVTWKSLEDFRRLWAGEAIEYPAGVGDPVEVRIFPKPVQRQVPLWLTSGGSPETFTRAGELGLNMLTNFLGQDPEKLERHIALYRESLERHGHDPEQGRVTLMAHTFLGEDLERVREQVRGPFCEYLKTFTGLLDSFAKNFNMKEGQETLSPDDWEALLSFAFERYFQTAALFGTPASCLGMVERLRGIGVDEVACLIDFGIDEDLVLESLRHLDELRRLANRGESAVDGETAGREQGAAGE